MLAYPIDEAEELLRGKLAAAQTSLEHCEEDIDFLRDQITVCLWMWWHVNFWNIVADMTNRPWRLRSQEYTTGRSSREGKSRQPSAVPGTRTRAKADEGGYITCYLKYIEQILD